MSPHTREGRLIRTALKIAFPQASPQALKHAAHAAAYGASPKQIAAIMRDDAKTRAQEVSSCSAP